MTRENFLHLQSSDVQQIVDNHLTHNSTLAAFKIRDPAICSQIKYLSRAADKLPSYFASRCIIDALTYEQSSSEATACSKFTDLDMAHPELAIDLTCGLGVDSYALSKQFNKVIALEINELRAEITRYNFALLGVTNIEVINLSAEQFCAENQHIKADLIYVDPSRITDDNKKVYSIEDSKPNIALLLPLLKKMSSRIVIKLSPMFDVEECFNVFSDEVLVEVVSVKNECKEVLVKIGVEPKNTITNTLLRTSIAKKYSFGRDEPIRSGVELTAAPRFLHVIDVAFYKSRTVTNYMLTYHPEAAFDYQNYLFTCHELLSFEGQSFDIVEMCPYQPKNIRKILKERDIKRATIHHRNFPYSTAKIVGDLGIKDGGADHIILTTYNAVPTFFLVTLHK